RLQLKEVDLAAQALQPVFERLQDGSEFGIALSTGPQVLGQLATAAWGPLLRAPQQQALRDWALAAQALRGDAAIPRVPAPAAAPGPVQDAGLTPRELEVLQRIAAGDSNKLIARAFDLSPHTVKRHVANILDKLGVVSRGQAAAWVRSAG
ncbi:MAG TPA: helix-turn-helix transcriptional regulator, partial [Rhizobacter sp.]|nr:helix-turn-helix transcriptional regulator [Rhizobacter sp.]